MEDECRELGGHGVVGVQLTIGAFPAGGLEFKAIGTAIRAPGAPPLRQPFTSALSGQDFAKLILAGWVPAGLVLGISIGSRHDDWLTVTQTRWGAATPRCTATPTWSTRPGTTPGSSSSGTWPGTAPAGWSCRSMDMRVRERECPMQEGRRDHIVEATIIGTVDRQVRDARAAAEPRRWP